MSKVEKTIVVKQHTKENDFNINYFTAFYSGIMISLLTLSLIILAKFFAFLSDSVTTFLVEKNDLIITFWSFIIISFIVFLVNNNLFKQKKM
ncbi:MAG: hypothetical protein CR986_00560 [Ignavibacteriae bacterium]|nr:MAG: hypothetical protein CR986_00560 [Ignavibacteriota bacterium]